MSQPLTFAMGEFEAEFPVDRQYARNHMWAQFQHDDAGGLKTYRFGFTAYAVRLLQDVYFLEWGIDGGTEIKPQQEIGAIESKKAESDLYAPIHGRLATFNDALLSDPSAINVDKYGSGWLFEVAGIQLQDDGAPLLTPQQYIEHLDDVWAVTQRAIKGQMNA